jgi:aldose 1-epimerase
MNITKKIFGKTGEQTVHSFKLNNGVGMEVEILEFGALVRSILIPDRDGNIADVSLGWDTLEDYINDKTYFGATIGRVANRIGGDKILIDNVSYKIALNALPDFGKNHLHGGVKGLIKLFGKERSFKMRMKLG